MKRHILIIIIFSLTAALSLFLYYQQIKPEDAFNVANFPKQIADWQGEDIVLEEKVYEILETRNLLLREYKKSGEPAIVLYIIYSDKNRKASHPPEVCLTGSGVSIIKKTTEEITLTGSPLKTNYLIAEKGGARELMFYWFKSGKTFTPNYLNQQLRIMLNQLQGKSSGGAMIRISTTITKDEKETEERLAGFIREIMPTIVKIIP
ncbi:MAG: EpsI family protein [Candidatus Omnitrophota bacterium]|nr:EpsI family protein [Candidatus Omnitrophota bacterium]